MRSAAVFFAFVLCSTVAHVSTVALVGPISLTIGAPIALATATVSANALAAVAAAGGLAALAVVKGVVIGAGIGAGIGAHQTHHSYKRSTSNQEDEETSALMLEVAQKMDGAGCMSKLLCELEASSVEQLSPAALTLKSAFSEDSKLIIGAYRVAFNIGSTMAKTNPEACDITYTACPLPKSKLFHMIETTFSC